MATVACPGCGLPRVASELGAKPCPVCEAAPSLAPAPKPPAPPAEPDPTRGLPADASQLDALPPSGGSRWPLVGAAFVAGALAGVGGVLGIQALTREPPQPETGARTVYEPIRPEVVPVEPRSELAPMPRAARTAPTAVETAPVPRLVKQQFPHGRVTIVELNEPDATYVVPTTVKKGEHVVLKGKVKTLRVTGLDLGAVLDATALEAETINVGARIDGHSTLKLNAPNGVVHFGGWVGGGSIVEVNAPGGEVKFMYATAGAKPGSKIDGGAKVSITGRFVEFKGDIAGADTKVLVTLTRNAWLKVASVSGAAAFEYRSQAGGWATPDVTVGSVAPTATFRLRKE